MQTAVVLPYNEYFDDQCTYDTRSALGAYVNKVFPGKTDDFISLVKGECARNPGAGTERQKRENERAISFGRDLAEAIRYVPGRPVRNATIILFGKDHASDCEVDSVVVRRALALAAAPGLASSKEFIAQHDRGYL